MKSFKATPNFTKWFKQSKAVDSVGNPMVLYHGTNKDFTAFSTNTIGSRWDIDDWGFFFTPDSHEASGYATMDGRTDTDTSVMPVYLSIQKPLTFKELFWYYGGNNASESDIIEYAKSEIEGRSMVNYFETSMKPAEWMEFIKDGGFDGIILRDPESSQNGLYIVLSPSQIKSVFNNGEFGPTDHLSESVSTGFKIMTFDPDTNRLVSLMDGSKYSTRTGTKITMGGKGVYISNNRDFVMSHYTDMTDMTDALVTLSYDPASIISGNDSDRESEFTVTSATIVDVEPLPKSLTEKRLIGSAIRDNRTGKIYGPAADGHHGVRSSAEMMKDHPEDPTDDDPFYDRLDRIFDLMDTNQLEDGFLDDAGKFYSREDAAKAIRLDSTITNNGAGNEAGRTWLDALDLHDVDNTIHERAGVDQSTSKTLYHGTTLAAGMDAMKYGLSPMVGDLVSTYYDDPDEEPPEDLVFAADKGGLSKAISAMTHHVAKALRKSQHRVTSKELYKYGALLVIQNGGEDFDHYDDNAQWEPDHPISVEPDDYYTRYPTKPDYMLTGLKLKKFIGNLVRSKKAPLHVMPVDQQQGIFTSRAVARDRMKEDVESDVSSSEILLDVLDEMTDKFVKHLTKPIWNTDSLFVRFKGHRMIRFYGATLGLQKPFNDLIITLAPEDFNTAGAFFEFAPKANVKKPIRIVTFSVLPTDPEMSDSEKLNIGLTRLLTKSWQGIILHELAHVQQAHNKIPFNQKGSFVDNTPTPTNYYNSPHEFDAYYQQRTKDYHQALIYLRKHRPTGLRMIDDIGFDPDFKTALEKMLPKNYDDDEFGMWYYASKRQGRRLIKRLYGLHQAIQAEINKPMNENDEKHQAALDQTGFWGNRGAGCIIVAKDTHRILLPLRSQWVQEPQTWGTWGGAIDEGEDPKTAAIREVAEEAGYTGEILEMIHIYTFKSDDFRYDTYIAMIEHEFDPEMNWENEDAEWVEFGQWPSPLHFGLDGVLKDTSALNKIKMATA